MDNTGYGASGEVSTAPHEADAARSAGMSRETARRSWGSAMPAATCSFSRRSLATVSMNPHSCIGPLGDANQPAHPRLGGHIGLFALFALERSPQSTITSYEPDEANRAILEQARLRNAFDQRWTVQPQCAGASPGVATFAALGDSISHITRGPDEGTPCAIIDVLPELGSSDLVKNDIEGSGWAILNDPRLQQLGPAVIALEYHAEEGALDATAARARAAELLGAASYAVEDAAPPSDIAGVLWAWKTT